jgi:DNA replication and repair protein RecF
MKVASVELVNYRNYASLSLRLAADINIFLGCNAQGKTNILEAVYYAALGRSHRTQAENELIRWNQNKGSLRLNFTRMDVENRLEFYFDREKRRQILYNGKNIRTRELVGAFNVVLFSPEDLFLIKGAPAGRRHFLDNEISQASPSYYHDLAVYTRLVTQRNTLLKRIREHRSPASMLENWDPQLAVAAAKVVEKRLAAVSKLNMLANLMQRRLSANEENLSLVYELHGFPDKIMTDTLVSWYNKRLKESVEIDIMRGATGAGPHRDDLVFLVNDINLRSFGSQGQQRTSVLALKLAELEFLRSETGEYPVLLLDDVMSELDQRRRQALLAFIRREHIQTLITATDEAYFPADFLGNCYRVDHGQITMG